MWDFEMKCLQLSHLCPFDASDRMLKEKIERSLIIHVYRCFSTVRNHKLIFFINLDQPF